MRFRPGTPVTADALQAEGLLVVDPGTGEPARRYDPVDPVDVPTLRATSEGSTVVVRATGPVVVTHHPAGGETALQSFGDEYAAGRQVLPHAEPPAVWCSWYHYFEQVTAADIEENLRGIDERALAVDVVQIDDGWSPGLGEGLAPSPEFGSLPALVDAIRASGRRAGLWLAPFLAGTRTTLAREHPDWLVGPAGRNWGQDLAGLDLTHPGVQELLRDALGRVVALGVDYLKLDFLYGGAVPGPRYDDVDEVAAYRTGLALVREAVGPGRVPRRLWGTAAPERGTGGRDARLARHLPRGRRGRLRWAARADASGGPGVDAGPALGQRPRLCRRTAVVPPARAVGRGGRPLRRAAVLLRPRRRSGRLGPGDRGRAAGLGGLPATRSQRTGCARVPSSRRPRGRHDHARPEAPRGPDRAVRRDALSRRRRRRAARPGRAGRAVRRDPARARGRATDRADRLPDHLRRRHPPPGRDTAAHARRLPARPRRRAGQRRAPAAHVPVDVRRRLRRGRPPPGEPRAGQRADVAGRWQPSTR